jgi:hypothetical protein
MAFDIASYTRVTGRLEVADLDFAEFARNPLPADARRCLRYMHDVEQHTVCYLRDLLVTRAHRDPNITAFLTFWNFEEYWHGEAIGQVLAAHGEPAWQARIGPMREQLGWRDAVRPVSTMLSSALARDFTAVHMTWGAINEWTTQAGYARLAAKANHPLLTELLTRIMRQEGRHIDFYSSEARRRLDGRPRAQKLTRLALRKFWKPVGAGVMPDAELRFLVHYLFEGDDGLAMAERIDRRVDRLPGLSGLGIITTARTRLLASAPA